MIRYEQINVVYQEVRIGFRIRFAETAIERRTGSSRVTSHGKSNAAVLPIGFDGVTPRYGHVINDPMVLVVQTHAFF